MASISLRDWSSNDEHSVDGASHSHTGADSRVEAFDGSSHQHCAECPGALDRAGPLEANGKAA